MPEAFVFWMGKFEARIPADRRYAHNHTWLLPLDDAGWYRVGFTAYSVRLLLDVYFLDWKLGAGAAVAAGQEIGEIESSKAVSSLFAPVAGRITAFNRELLDDPSAINTDNYGAGWLFDFHTTAPLLSAPEYVQFLEAGWEKTQRLLKGQLNR